VPLARLQPAEHRIWLAGVVASARAQMTRRGRMMVVVLDDGSAQVELSVFNELYEKHRDKLKEDALLIVQGKVQRDEFAGGLRVTADELYDLAGLRERYAARLRLAMNGHSDAQRLKELLAPFRAPGACTVSVHYENGAAACEIALGDTWRVRPDGQLLEHLGAWLAPENVQVVYAGVG
jgi:DNA polymerase-3 subunit alpha